ncbi:MAG: hypothetical protein C0596_05185 [Marinilabiliales bacterium]|nr:MAG: hypothetical protein C0596_05185 [Marinilabiliales bacterium]
MASVEGNANLNLFVPQTWEDFDTVDISLDEFKNQEVLIRFKSINDRGSVVYIDYVRLGNTQLTGIEAQNIISDFEIYPNPASDYLTLESSNRQDNETLLIYNSSGQLIKSFKLDNDRMRISIEDLSSGIYFLRLNNSLTNYKLIVQ